LNDPAVTQTGRGSACGADDGRTPAASVGVAGSAASARTANREMVVPRLSRRSGRTVMGGPVRLESVIPARHLSRRLAIAYLLAKSLASRARQTGARGWRRYAESGGTGSSRRGGVP